MTEFVTLLHGEVFDRDFVQHEIFVTRVSDLRMIELDKRLDGGEGRVLHPVDVSSEVANKFDTATFCIESGELYRIHPFDWDGSKA